jgi:hypothetical protein
MAKRTKRFRQLTGLPISGITRKPIDVNAIKRRHRRALTLAAAKREMKEQGLPRAKLGEVWDRLMTRFPEGTLRRYPEPGHRHGR